MALTRLPRASPEPRVAPNEPNPAGAGALATLGAGLAGAASSAGTGAAAGKSAGAGIGAPDFSGSDMCVLVL